MQKVSLANRESRVDLEFVKAKCNLEKFDLHLQVKLDLGYCHPCAEMCGRYF